MASSKEIIKIGFDPGFGRTKLAWLNGETNIVEFPSLVGAGRVSQGALSLAGLEARGRETLPFQVAFDGLDYLVGDGVGSFTHPNERLDMGRFTDGTDLRALLYVGLSMIEAIGQVALAIGLPVELLIDKAQATAIEREMAGWLVGKHRWLIDGREQAVEIVKIRASVAQPLGAWLDWGMDSTGKWVKGQEGRKAPALVIDQGFNTLDLFAVEDGRPSALYTAGDTLGMRRSAELVRTNVRRKHGVEIGLYQADGLMRLHLEGKTPTIYVHGEPVAITAEITQALGTVAAEVVNFVDGKLGKEANRFRIILTGGGALALAGSLMRQFPYAEMAPQPSIANARGLGKLALTDYL